MVNMRSSCQGRKALVLVFILITLCFVLHTFNGFCGGPGTTGATFLKLAIGTRPVAMGEAFVAVADDVNALAWNPAGLAQIKERQASLVATEWFQGIHYSYLGYCQPLLGGVIGGSGTILWIDGIERRSSDTPSSEGWIAARDIAISISYGKTILEKLSLGATIKVISQQLDNYYSGGLALDIGALYKQSETLNFALAIQNIGSKGAFIQTSDPLPLNLKLGLANKYLPDESGQSKLCHYNLTLAADLNYGIMDSILSVGAGMDWQVHPMFAVRGGYKYNSAMSSLGFLSGLTIGGGFKYNIFDIDYAFVPYGDLGYTHRISLIARF